ncbi:MAG: ABC transporter ATP-binding protein [Bacteroidetes bacterium]|nr:ABC transporter ATP-binding protein [Bacteroidota bacterium]
MITLQVNNISKSYNQQTVFNEVSLFASEKYSLAITGKNGSGKSTLLKIIAKLVTPTVGSVLFFENEFQIFPNKLNSKLSFVAPYLFLYEELTAIEHLTLIQKLKRISNNILAIELLKKFSLIESKHKKVGSFSSGMLQRLKYCIALVSKPKILLLDEPTSNLDHEGEIIIYDLLKAAKKNNTLLIYTTNHKSELKYADDVIDLNKLK